MDKTKNKIRDLRISKNMTQQQLADQLHVTKQTISKWEKGKSIPDITSIELLSDYFGISVDYLVNDNVETSKPNTEAVITTKRVNKLIKIYTSLLAIMLVTIVALSVTVGILLNQNKHTDTVAINGFEITYLTNETPTINSYDKTIILNFNIYNNTEHIKTCSDKHFTIDNKALYLVYVAPDEAPVEAHEELKLQIVIGVLSVKNLDAVSQRSVTVSYSGRAIASIKW